MSARSRIPVLPRFCSVGCSALVSRSGVVASVDLDSMSERELERLYAGLLRVAALSNEELQALVRNLLESDEPVSTSQSSRR